MSAGPMSAGSASVPRPEAARPRDDGRPADSRSRAAQHEADDAFAGVLTAIADDRAGPPGPPGETPETPARTATAEGQEGESDSPAPTGSEDSLLADVVATPPTPVPTAQISEVPGAAGAAPPSQQGAPCTPDGPVGAPPAPDASGVQQTSTPTQPNDLTAPPAEGQRRLDGKPSSTPHRRTPVQTAAGPMATGTDDAAADPTSPAHEASSQLAAGTPAATVAGSPARAEDARAAQHAVPATAHARGEQHGETGEATTATAAPAAGANGASGSSSAPTHEEPRGTAAAEPTAPDQPAAQPSSPAGPGRQADTAAKAAAAAPHGRTELHELVARVRETIRVTVREERTEARITLHPAELGEVRIRVSYGPAGVSASIVADSSRAAQTLAQSTHELRRTLEEHGVTLQSVDVHVAGDGAQLGSENSPSGAAAGSDSDARRQPTADTPATEDELAVAEPIGQAPLGAYVDVLA